MKLGAFSVSLNVTDLAASKAFYETLGFDVMAGDADAGFLILKQGSTLIGLFQGMLDETMLTFNPGWAQDASEVNPFDDVREIKKRCVEAGLQIEQEQGGETGPASFVLTDPDGMKILIDQHR